MPRTSLFLLLLSSPSLALGKATATTFAPLRKHLPYSTLASTAYPEWWGHPPRAICSTVNYPALLSLPYPWPLIPPSLCLDANTFHCCHCPSAQMPSSPHHHRPPTWKLSIITIQGPHTLEFCLSTPPILLSLFEYFSDWIIQERRQEGRDCLREDFAISHRRHSTQGPPLFVYPNVVLLISFLNSEEIMNIIIMINIIIQLEDICSYINTK